MKEQLQHRLEELKQEYETGQARLRELESEANYVRETMLRIGGAIQVIEELLEHEQQDDAKGRASEATPGG